MVAQDDPACKFLEVFSCLFTTNTANKALVLWDRWICLFTAQASTIPSLSLFVKRHPSAVLWAAKCLLHLWKDEGWYLWHVFLGSSTCVCIHPHACTCYKHVYASGEVDYLTARKDMFVTESWLVRCFGWLLFNLDSKSPSLHGVWLEIQMQLLHFFTPSNLSADISSYFVFHLRIIFFTDVSV